MALNTNPNRAKSGASKVFSETNGEYWGLNRTQASAARLYPYPTDERSADFAREYYDYDGCPTNRRNDEGRSGECRPFGNKSYVPTNTFRTYLLDEAHVSLRCRP
ncbi:MAG: hypothetical protein LBT30_06155 [Clostridiales bacterium]|jgi:hypothetical protein|nr:hypothetical protein [Clostridiales bacterium]